MADAVATLVNGRPEDRCSALDRGLHYGDGLFETLAVHDGQPLHWALHLERLTQGCRRLRIPPPDAVQLRREAESLCPGQARAVLKLIVTRGVGGRGYRPPAPAEAQPTRIVQRHPWPEYPASFATAGVAVRICEQRLGDSPALAGIKHLNRLENVLARSEWDDPAIAEGLLLDREGNVISGTMTNLFWVEAGRLHTPPVDRCGIAGITRRRILAWAAQRGRAVAIEPAPLARLEAAAELFVCNSVIGIWPVRELAGRPFPLGPVTAAIAETLGP